MAVPGAAGGQFFGGYICKRLNLKVKGMLRFMIIVCVLAMILDNVVWVRCTQENIAGVNTQYSHRYWNGTCTGSWQSVITDNDNCVINENSCKLFRKELQAFTIIHYSPWIQYSVKHTHFNISYFVLYIKPNNLVKLHVIPGTRKIYPNLYPVHVILTVAVVPSSIPQCAVNMVCNILPPVMPDALQQVLTTRYLF